MCGPKMKNKACDGWGGGKMSDFVVFYFFEIVVRKQQLYLRAEPCLLYIFLCQEITVIDFINYGNTH